MNCSGIDGLSGRMWGIVCVWGVTAFAVGWVISLGIDVYRKTKKMQDPLEEKEVLLSEIYHRVKNNLAVMSGLILPFVFRQ